MSILSAVFFSCLFLFVFVVIIWLGLVFTIQITVAPDTSKEAASDWSWSREPDWTTSQVLNLTSTFANTSCVFRWTSQKNCDYFPCMDIMSHVYLFPSSYRSKWPQGAEPGALLDRSPLVFFRLLSLFFLPTKRRWAKSNQDADSSKGIGMFCSLAKKQSFQLVVAQRAWHRPFLMKHWPHVAEGSDCTRKTAGSATPCIFFFSPRFI